MKKLLIFLFIGIFFFSLVSAGLYTETSPSQSTVVNIINQSANNYTAGSNLTLAAYEFSVDMSGLEAYLDTIYNPLGSGISWAQVANGTMFTTAEANNGTYIVNSVLNNGTYNFDWNSTGYIIDWTPDLSGYYTSATIDGFSYYNSTNFSISDYASLAVLNNGTYNVVDTDTFVANYTTFLNKVDWADVNNGSITTIETLWNANYTAFLALPTLAEIVAFSYYNSTDFSISDYYTSATIDGFSYYNSTDFSISDYYTSATIDGFSYYNSTDFSISDYYTSATVDGFGYYNSTDFSISDYASLAILNNGTYSVVDTDTFVANFSDFESIQNFISNSTFYLDSNPDNFVEWDNAVNGTLALFADLINGTFTDTDTDTFVANFSDFEAIQDFISNSTFYLDSNPDSFVDWATVVNGTLLIEETLWNANFSDFEHIQDLVSNSTFYLDSNPDGFVDWDMSVNGTLALFADLINGTFTDTDTDTFVGNYSAFLALPTLAEINAFGFYNSTDFSISDYYTSATINGFSYYNSTDFSISDYATLAILNNGTYTFDWNSTGYIKNWDPNSYIKDWNSTGFIKNWETDLSAYSTTVEADGLYAGIEWDYNQTIASLFYANSNFFDSSDAATFASLSLTSQLAVGQGGTGQQSFTDGCVLFGSDSGALTCSAALPAGTIIIGDGTGDPAAVTMFTAFNGFLKDEFGGLEANLKDYSDGLYGIASGETIEINTSALMAAAIDDETGTGLMVFETSPTLVTPILGVAAATSLNTGEGDNELFDMDQNVLQASDVTFNNITTEGLILEVDNSHRVYDNATCIIITGDTSTLNIC